MPTSDLIAEMRPGRDCWRRAQMPMIVLLCFARVVSRYILSGLDLSKLAVRGYPAHGGAHDEQLWQLAIIR
eukprot:11110848-Lingulodinium_polyedra.AAC.1